MALYTSLSLCVRLLNMAGLWPPASARHWLTPAGLLYRLFTAVMVAPSWHILLPEAAGLVHFAGDMKAATEDMCLLCAFVTTSYKLLVILLRRTQIVRFVEALDARVTAMAAESAEARAVVRRRDLWSRRLALFMVIQSTSAAVIWSVNGLRIGLTMGSSLRTLPIISWYPYNMTVWSNYEVTFFTQMLALVTAAFCNRACDILIITLMTQISSLLEMLNLKFRDVSKIDQSPATSNTKKGDRNYTRSSTASVLSSSFGRNGVLEPASTMNSKIHSEAEMYNSFVRCIQQHQEIISFAEELEKLMNDVLLVDFLCCMVVTCSTLYVSTSAHENFGDLLSHFGYLVAMTYPLLLYCLSAHEIKDQSQQVSMSAYCSPWHQATKGYRRALCVVMCRAQRPLTLTAGKFYVVSRATFLTLMNASYSYYNILREINDSKRSD
ncbi:odorant receptor 83a-like [Schistocerca gregaria]|uniref:odorant receptor 83a-like n=1 Tax=Schistocerca gregaria TaxID=7010 RepID=UPI00211DE655|nr:odorant receptor 83a-like [Schistocerca gregaria]